MSWSEIPLGEIAEFRNGLNYTKKNEGLGLLVINVKDFGDRFYPDYNKLGELNPCGIVSDKSLLKNEDIIFVRSNGNKDLVGRSLYIENPPENVSYSAFCIRARMNDSVLPKFYAYYFKSPFFRKQLSLLGKGTNISNLNQEVLKKILVPKPSKQEQYNIIKLIDPYNALIENNQRRIELLEQAPQLLYKEWFVNLRFPGHEHTKIVDGVPEGWEKKTLGDVAEVTKGKNITQKSAIEGNIPVVAGGLTPSYYHNTSNVQGPVVTVSASGVNSGYVNLYLEDIWASDCSYINKSSTDYIYYFYLLLSARQREIFRLQKGAAQPHVYPKDLKRLSMLYPSERILNLFEEHVSKNFELISCLRKQNKLLIKARDLLLPKLMSGEISV